MNRFIIAEFPSPSSSLIAFPVRLMKTSSRVGLFIVLYSISIFSLSASPMILGSSVLPFLAVISTVLPPYSLTGIPIFFLFSSETSFPGVRSSPRVLCRRLASP